MSAGRAGRAAALALFAAALAAPAALGAAPPTEVTGVQPEGAHSVRVVVKAAGDLSTSDVEADLGGRFAFVEGVHQTGPVRPTDLVFAVDTSGSMAGAPIAAATAAGRRLLDAVGHTGRVGLVTFSDSAQVVRPLTADTGAVRAALAGLDTHSGTALYDGIGLAVDTALAGADPGARRIVVVLSDGADTSSASTLAALTHRLRGAGVEVDAVGLESSPSFQTGPLREIASATGGELAPTRTLAGLEPIALQLSQARLATTYAVDVSLPQSSARSLHVRVRGGSPASVALPAGVSGASAGFWSAYGGVLVIVLGVAAVGMAAFVVSAASGARVPPLSTRLAQYTAEGGAGAPRARSLFMLELSEALEARLGERWAWKRLDRLCGQAGIVRPTGHVALATAASAAAGGLAATAFVGLLAGIVGLACGLAAPIAGRCVASGSSRPSCPSSSRSGRARSEPAAPSPRRSTRSSTRRASPRTPSSAGHSSRSGSASPSSRRSTRCHSGCGRRASSWSSSPPTSSAGWAATSPRSSTRSPTPSAAATSSRPA